jgi:hypothetical protein
LESKGHWGKSEKESSFKYLLISETSLGKENKSKVRESRNPRRDLRRDFGGVRKFRFLINKQKLIIGEP